MKNQNIVIFSSDDWGWKTSKYQLSIRFARENTVLFVSSIGFRAPKANKEDFGRIVRKLKSFFAGVKEVEPNLFVLTPIVIPFKALPGIDRFNQWVLKMQLWAAARKLKISDPYVFVFSQNWLPYVERANRRKLIYYCVDDHSSFEGLDQIEFVEQDKKLSTLADEMFCSSKLLAERKKKQFDNVNYMPHGVNFDHFNKALKQDLPLPSDMTNSDRPKVLFFGHISYDWVDPALMKFLATERPEYDFLLVGRYSMSEDEFDGYQNILLLGEKDFSELPAYCRHSSVGIIPFVDSDLTANCNPLKLPEYASAGLPVVSTNIPEVVLNDKYVTVAETYDQFVTAIDNALTEDSQSRAVELADDFKNATWEHRVEQIYDVIR